MIPSDTLFQRTQLSIPGGVHGCARAPKADHKLDAAVAGACA